MAKLVTGGKTSMRTGVPAIVLRDYVVGVCSSQRVDLWLLCSFVHVGN